MIRNSFIRGDSARRERPAGEPILLGDLLPEVLRRRGVYPEPDAVNDVTFDEPGSAVVVWRSAVRAAPVVAPLSLVH